MLSRFSRIATYATIFSCCFITYSCNKNESQSNETTGSLNGHEYVDLGLSVKWATCNVGTSSPEDYGDYFAWGETKTKSTYDIDNCSTLNKDIGDIAGDPSYDAARANWGGTWRMPTKDEIDELITKCKWTLTCQGEHKGYEVTGPNGNSIFLPAAGYLSGTSLYDAGRRGFYWGSTPYGGDAQRAFRFGFGLGGFGWGWYDRVRGRSVRPVTK